MSVVRYNLPPTQAQRGRFSAQGSQLLLQCSDSEHACLLGAARLSCYFPVIKPSPRLCKNSSSILSYCSKPSSPSLPSQLSASGHLLPTDCNNGLSTMSAATAWKALPLPFYRWDDRGTGWNNLARATAGVQWGGESGSSLCLLPPSPCPGSTDLQDRISPESTGAVSPESSSPDEHY